MYICTCTCTNELSFARLVNIKNNITNQIQRNFFKILIMKCTHVFSQIKLFMVLHGVEWLEEFRTVSHVVAFIRFACRPNCVVYVVLCRLPNKLPLSYNIKRPNFVIFCIFKNKIATLLFIKQCCVLFLVFGLYKLLHLCTQTSISFCKGNFLLNVTYNVL